MWKIIYLTIIAFLFTSHPVPAQTTGKKMDGYRGIWFELNQKFEYGDKYSGGLGTYTAKHVPLAAYAEEVNKTFFVYGGTTQDTARYLLCMIGIYDHNTGKVSKPTIVYDKKGVNDPHDNPSIMIGDDGHLWVFVSGRGRGRSGFKFRSKKPYDIEAFEMISEKEITYPQPWNTSNGYLHLFTKYTGVRQLFFESSTDGFTWTEDKLLAAIAENQGERSGHYQTSACFEDEKVGTFFNRHPDGNVDKRTDLYYMETGDLGETWTSANGEILQIPLLEPENPALITNYQTSGKNVYMKDMAFDPAGNPVCLYLRSNGHEPGPDNAPYEWCLTRWDGLKWVTTVVTESDHNYDMGSLFISEKNWRIVAPLMEKPQKWGAGGEIEIWQSTNQGKTWIKTRELTNNSRYNHSYIRKPLNFKPPFCFFWADGHPNQFSKSELYFGDFDGNVWKLPYVMEGKNEFPQKIY
ncbi:MAG: BNR-4 repeat-containing protein [Mariniphaga sp.]|nr:BNR-4 repeat-containing protein [Mariniphaga sp.]MDD4226341.1 BNR-4 repeat-containing protein [Mariniphaga sp.]MDD4426409.1 BNR-4 repeat-containing protein [Mariniphaga sp.]